MFSLQEAPCGQLKGGEGERDTHREEREKENGAETKSRPSTRRLSRGESEPKRDPQKPEEAGSGVSTVLTPEKWGRMGPGP